MEPERPTRPSRWNSLGPAPLLPDARIYRHRHVYVISGFEAGEWHVSVTSLRLGTVSDAELERVRETFSMKGAVEEHGVLRGGRTRHLRLPALELAS